MFSTYSTWSSLSCRVSLSFIHLFIDSTTNYTFTLMQQARARKDIRLLVRHNIYIHHISINLWFCLFILIAGLFRFNYWCSLIKIVVLNLILYIFCPLFLSLARSWWLYCSNWIISSRLNGFSRSRPRMIISSIGGQARVLTTMLLLLVSIYVNFYSNQFTLSNFILTSIWIIRIFLFLIYINIIVFKWIVLEKGYGRTME